MSSQLLHVLRSVYTINSLPARVPLFSRAALNKSVVSAGGERAVEVIRGTALRAFAHPTITVVSIQFSASGLIYRCAKSNLIIAIISWVGERPRREIVVGNPLDTPRQLTICFDKVLDCFPSAFERNV